MAEPLRVPVQPELLRWACERNGVGPYAFAERVPQLESWLDGSEQPTLKQLEGFAKLTYTPVGFFFLPRPPQELLPLPDFRTRANRVVERPSPNLLETIYLAQQRQDWYRDHARVNALDPCSFVGSARVEDGVNRVAAQIRLALSFEVEARTTASTHDAAMTALVSRVDALGILVMVSGVVANNTSRSLDPDEFRGFALSDPLAPLVFVNGADTKAAQLFTLAHEVAHLWLGETALSDAQAIDAGEASVETWCNAVAAEVLVPLDVLRADVAAGVDLDVPALTRRYKVSSLVMLRRLHDAGFFGRAELEAKYAAEVARLRAVMAKRAGGGDFYRTQVSRVGRRFTEAILTSALEGQTLRRDALHLLSLQKAATFDRLGETLGVG